MNRIPPIVRGLGVIALIAIVIVVLQAQTALATASTILQFVFLIAMAVVAYMVWRDFGRREISTWPDRQQRVFYCAIALFVADIGWFSLVSLRGLNALVFLLVAVGSVTVAVRTWRDRTRY